ncbi:putative surface protein bspA-like [Bienertia sinuspersici]
MSEKIVLKFKYRGSEVDVVVDDVDKAMLMDLVIEYWEKAESKHMMFARYPELTYLHKMTHYKVENDKDLVLGDSDFENFNHINVDETWADINAAKRTKCKGKGKSLRFTDGNNNSENPILCTPPINDKEFAVASQSQPLQKLSEPLDNQFEPLQNQSEPLDNHSEPLENQSEPLENQSNPLENNSEPLQNHSEPLQNNSEPLEIQYEPFENQSEPLQFHSETLENQSEPVQNHKAMENQSDPVDNPSHQIENPIANDHVNLKLSKPMSTIFRKKVPNTTAKRKKIPTSFQSQKNVSTTFRNKRNATVSLGDDPGDHDDSSDDDPYNPDSDSDFSDDTDESVCEEDDEEVEEDYTFMVNDNYDPYDEPKWDDNVDNDDNYFSKLYKNGELYEEKKWGDIVLKPWQLFTDKQHLRDVLRDYCIQCGFSVIVLSANNIKYTVTCSSEGCGWRLHAGKLPDGMTWAIKSIQNPEHTCVGLEGRNPMVNVKWDARVLLEDIREHNDTPAKALNEKLSGRFGITMCMSTLYRVRKKALIEIHGGHDVSYSHLPLYYEVIHSTNPGSIAHCAWNPPTHVERPLAFVNIFISFKGCLEGLFAGYRSLIGIDGAHLKGNYGGVLLSAIALDGNNEIFPVAWGIIAGEDEEAWNFFIWHLKRALEPSGRGDEWCIISDRQKGIENALSNYWPKCDRRICCKHLSKNWKRKFAGPLMLSLFWRVCGAYSPFTFRKAMDTLKKVNPMAVEWLADLGEQSAWTIHKFNPVVTSDVNKSNFVESFNATLGIERCRPVLTLLESIRRVTMVRMATRRQMCEEWTRDDLCPNIIKRIKVICHESRTCIAHLSAEGEYEVVDGRSTLPVSLNNKKCACGRWQISGIPCKHACRAILSARLDPHSFTSQWYTVENYKAAYQFSIHSIPDMEQWPESNGPVIQPPVMRRGIGRPSRNRKREEDEQAKCKRSKTVQCSSCKQFGHNAKTSKGGLTAKEKGNKKQAAKKKGANKAKGGPKESAMGGPKAATKTAKNKGKNKAS